MARSTNPSFASGLALLRRSPRLVLAVWIVPAVLMSPFVMTVQAAFAQVLGRLPSDPAPGDLQLVLSGLVGRYGPALVVPAALGVVSVWLWTVLWHAGVVAWRTWAAGRSQRLGELLGLGVMRWWRYLRLSLVAGAAAVAAVGAVAAGTHALSKPAARALQETTSLRIVLAGSAVGCLLLLVLWAATLRGLWELGRPGRRSALLAWLRGLGGTVRHPLASVGVTLACALLLGVLWAVPLAGVAAMGAVGRGALGVLVLQLGALLRAAVWVVLVGSFAPVAGLAPLGPLEMPERAAGAAPAHSEGPAA